MTVRLLFGILTLVVLRLICPDISQAGDWPQFRGPNGLSTTTSGTNLPTEWSKDKNIAWKVKIPGSGWAQPVVVGDKVFVATAVTDPPFTPKGMLQGVMDPSSRPAAKAKGPKPGPDIKIDWQLLCLDLNTGKELWTKTASSGKPKYAIHVSNSYATETPCADAERVYTFFGAAGVLVAYDHSGKEVWRKELGTYPGMSDLGLGASPAIFEGKLFVPLLNEEKSIVLCLEAKTGNELWKVERDKPGTSWATPFIWTNKTRTELVVCGKSLVTSHDLKDGKELWRFTNVDSSFSSSATANDQMIVFGNGGPGSISPLIGIKHGAKGDISLKEKETSNEYVAFFKPSAAPGMSSAVADGDLLYVPKDGRLTCYEIATGKQVYKESLGSARMLAATPVLVNGKLFITEEGGKTVVVKAGKEFEILATNPLDDLIWSSVAVAGDRILIRGVKELYCIRKADQ